MIRRLFSLLSLVAVAACNGPTQAVPDAPVATSSARADEPELPFTRKPRPAAFAAPSPDTRSQAQIDAAACTAADGSWRCALAKPKTFGAPGSTPIIPASWTVPNWFVNKSTGSDSNACTSSGSPCATKQEIWVHRLGAAVGTCPRFRQTTVIEQDASDTDNTDPFYPCAANEIGSTFSVQGGPMTCTAAVFTRNTAKNRAAGTNALLSGSFSAGVPAVGKIVVNTTAGKASRAHIVSTAGGANWNLSQPLVPATGIPPTTNFPAEVDTWASTDTVNVCTPIAINLVSLGAMVTDYNGGFNNLAWGYQFTVFDPGGVGNDNVYLNSNVAMFEVVSQREVVLSGGSFGHSIINSNLLGGTFSQPSEGTDDVFNAGALQSPFGSTLNGLTFLDGDIVIGTGGGGVNFGLGALFGFAFLDGQVTMNGGGSIALTPGGAAYGNSILYGSSTNTINLNGSAHFANLTTHTFANTFTAPGLVTGIKLNGTATGSSITGAAAINQGISTTPAHLDAAAGAAGFGSNAFNFGGASVANF